MDTKTEQGQENDKKRKDPPKNPLTVEGEQPQKRFYRQRAHCNPLSHNDAFCYPVRPSDFDWTAEHYPAFSTTTAGNSNNNSTSRLLQPTVLDVGCGFGGLTMALGEILPKTTLILGLEIRAKVTEYVRLRIVAARQQQKGNDKNKQEKKDETAGESGGTHHNVSVMRSNTQKFLPNYFAKHSLEKLFFCFPDPHFKRKNHPRRIISDRLLAEYAYLLQPGVGKLYCITDVEELHAWHVQKCTAHPLFQEVSEAENDADPCVAAMQTKTEEGQKVERNKGQKYYAVYRRISEDAEKEMAAALTAQNFFPVSSSTTTTSAASSSL